MTARKRSDKDGSLNAVAANRGGGTVRKPGTANRKPGKQASQASGGGPARKPYAGARATASNRCPQRSAFGGKKLWALFGGLTMLALAGGTSYYLKSQARLHVRRCPSTPRASSSRRSVPVGNCGHWNRDVRFDSSLPEARFFPLATVPRPEDVPIDLAQLRAGSIMYAPLSTDVAFRLEVKDGKSGSLQRIYKGSTFGSTRSELPADACRR